VEKGKKNTRDEKERREGFPRSAAWENRLQKEKEKKRGMVMKR